MKEKNVKMNLTLNKEFYEKLKNESARDYMKVSTWVKQQMMKVVYGNKREEGMDEYGSNENK